MFTLPHGIKGESENVSFVNGLIWNINQVKVSSVFCNYPLARPFFYYKKIAWGFLGYFTIISEHRKITARGSIIA